MGNEKEIKCPQCAFWFDMEEVLSGKLGVYFKDSYEKKYGIPHGNRKDKVQCPSCGYWIDLKGVSDSKL